MVKTLKIMFGILQTLEYGLTWMNQHALRKQIKQCQNKTFTLYKQFAKVYNKLNIEVFIVYTDFIAIREHMKHWNQDQLEKDHLFFLEAFILAHKDFVPFGPEIVPLIGIILQVVSPFCFKKVFVGSVLLVVMFLASMAIHLIRTKNGMKSLLCHGIDLVYSCLSLEHMDI